MSTRIAVELAVSLIASMSYGILFNVPWSILWAGGITGLLGWLGYSEGLHTLHWGPVASIFLGSLLVSASSELFARFKKRPTTVFIVPGIIPLVPGVDAYTTMLLFFRGDVTGGVQKAIQTAFLAGSVAAGLILVGTIFRALKPKRKSRPAGNGDFIFRDSAEDKR